MENNYLIVSEEKYSCNINPRSPFFGVKSNEEYKNIIKFTKNVALESSTLSQVELYNSNIVNFLDYIKISLGYCKINKDELINEIQNILSPMYIEDKFPLKNYELFIICEEKSSSNICSYTMLTINISFSMKNKILNMFGIEPSSFSLYLKIHHGSYFLKND